MGIITQKVWGFLDTEPTISRNLQRGVINQRALAKYIIKKAGLTTHVDSVTSAIRRYEFSERFNDYFYTISHILYGSVIVTRTNMALITVKNTNLTQIIKHIQNINNIERTKILNGDDVSKMIINRENLANIKRIFKDEIVDILHNVGEVKLILNEKAKDSKGILARISFELASYDIVIHEVISCVPEIFIYLNEKSLPKANEILIKMCNKDI